MEVTGKIIAALEPRSGVSQSTGKPWKIAQFVLVTQEPYPKHIVFEVFGEDKLQEFNIQVGDELTVAFTIDASEYTGRWYNHLRAWKVERTSIATSIVPTPIETVDDLPFDSPLPFDCNDNSSVFPF